MKLAPALLAALLLGGCLSPRGAVTLYPDEGVATGGAVAVFDAKTGAERGELNTVNTQVALGTGKFEPKAVKGDRFQDLLARVPAAPRHYVMYFYEGTTDLTPESMPILEALRKVVTESSDVEITGHTDTVGSSDSNDKLSYDRAVEIRAALVKKGLPIANARVAGRGERELRVQTPDNTPEPANRRVEVILR